MKIEYLGMVSVYTIIALYFFGGLPSLSQSITAAIGSFFLFLGLKKKTKDHFSGSLILFISVAIACGPVITAGWTLQYLMFGFSVFAMEGYLEKRQYRIYLLPILFFFWALKDASWLLGFIFVAMYLSHPWTEKPGLRRRLLLLVIISFLAGISTSLFQRQTKDIYTLCPFQHGLLAMDPLSMGLLFLIGVLTIFCLIMFWRKTVLPHRLNTLIFCAFSPLDGRLAALFAMAAVVLLSATLCRDSIYSDRLRPFFKHAEWYYFWIVFAVALYVVFNRPAI